jgi:hypothetical protein
MTESNYTEFPRLRDRRAGGWFYNENELVDIYMPRIGANGVAVYNILSRHSSEDTDVAFPKIGYMAERLGVSEKTVKRALKVLSDEQMIQRVPRFHNGRQLPNDYQLVSLKTGEGVTGDRVGGSLVTGVGGHSRPPAQEDSVQEDQDKNPPGVALQQTDPPKKNGKDYTAETIDLVRAEEFEPTEDQKKWWGSGFALELRNGTSDGDIAKMQEVIVEQAEAGVYCSVKQAKKILRGEATAYTKHEANGGGKSNGSEESPTPKEAIEAVRNHDYLKRYAPLLAQYDFSQLEEYQEPPYKIYAKLGGDDVERANNLMRLHSVVRRATQ